MQLTTIIHGTGNAWPEMCLANRRCWSLCHGPDRPLDGRGNTSLSLVGGDLAEPAFHVLVDTGQGAWQGILRSSLTLPDVIILTHGHPDHLNKMEIDTLARAAQDADRGKIPIVTSTATWHMIPEFQRSKFKHVRIEPNQEQTIEIREHALQVSAVDASDHFKGALIFTLRISDFRFGVLFDLKSWGNVDPTVIEGLDLAVIEGNSLMPLSSKTGHVSISEDLAFLNSLKKPPRLSLFTHYGHEDPRLYSQGSLVSLLTGIAPHLAVRLAYKGMMVTSDSLPPRNAVAIIHEDTNLVVGVAEKSEVHAQGRLHASVLLLVRDASGKLLVYKRHQGQSFPGCFDVFGGHSQPSDGGSPRHTALREASEEVRLYAGDFQVLLEDDWLVQISKDYELESSSSTNRERTTLFGIRVPEGLEVRAFDETDDGQEVKLAFHQETLEELDRLYTQSPSGFADGLARILEKMKSDKHFRSEVQSFLSG